MHRTARLCPFCTLCCFVTTSIGMSDSADDDQPLPKRICASIARSQLGATEKILSTLACQLKNNPHYRRAAPMRLYDTEEVQEAVQKAEADKQYREEHRDTIAAEKLAKQKEAAKQKANAAAQACTHFSKKSISIQDFAQGSHQTTKLPLDVWGSILEKLCPISFSALEGPSTIARHIINAQLICHESCAASGAAWAALAALIHHAPSQQERMARSPKSKQNTGAHTPLCAAIPNMPWKERFANPLRGLDNALHADVPWDQIVSKPLLLKNDVLKEACRSVGEHVSGTKAVLVLRLLQHFGIERPCAVPAIVLLAVKHEKVSYMSTQLIQSTEVALALGYAFHHLNRTDIAHSSVFAVRRVLASQFESIPQLLQFASGLTASKVSCNAPSGGKKRKNIGSRAKRNNAGRICRGCGNQPAPTCQQACCKNCCQGPCARHNC